MKVLLEKMKMAVSSHLRGVSAISLVIIVLCCGIHAQDELMTRRVTIPPLMTIDPARDVFFKEGESIEMPCVASGVPEPNYRWEYNKEDYSPSGNDGRVAIQPGVGTLIFARPIEKDEGIYQCIAENTVGVAISPIINLRIAILRPFPNNAVVRYMPNLGDALTLTCIPPQSLPEPEIYWATQKEGETITPIYLTDRVSIDPQGNLHFANVLASDYQEGRMYTCIVHNTVMRETVQGAYATITPQGTTINRHAPTILWQDATNQIAIVGEEIRIKCIFSGSPTPRVTWERALYPMPPRKREESFGQEMVITDVQFEDEGFYECVGINDDVNVEIRRSFHLIIESAPRFTIEPRSVDATEGDTAEIKCEGTAYPEPSYVWQLNHVPRTEIVQNNRYDYGTNFIRIHNLTKDDAMVIQCNVTNKHGYAFRNAYFNVLTEPPIILTPPMTDQKTAEGQTVNLTCEVFGSPRPLVVWQKGNEQLTGGRFRVMPEGHLQIIDVSLVDAGGYTCTATNNLDTTSATGSLIVRRKTAIVTAPMDVMIVEETEAKFTCTATTDPEEIRDLEIKWKKDGELIDYELAQRMFKNDMDNSLTISGSISLDTGKYTCMAVNGLDSDESSAQLVVQGKPDPPNKVTVECKDQERRAEITWQPGRENYAPILNFIVQYNTSFAPDTWIDIDAMVSQNVRRNDVVLSPYGNYTFRVLSRNKIGLSPPSSQTFNTCRTDQDIPDQNPENVIGEGDEPGNLVIYWTPMPPTEHNGPAFVYIVGWRRADEDGAPEETFTVEHSDVYHLVVRNVADEPYQPYDVYVKARNAAGDSREGVNWVRGFTGEDKPIISVNDLQVISEMTSFGGSITLRWTHVDTSPESVLGFFRGYRIQYWKERNDDNVHEVDYIMNMTSQYPRPRNKRQVSEDVLEYVLSDLPAYSTIYVQIRVLNKYYAGPPSNTVQLQTPQGIPGPPMLFDVIARGATHFELQWEEPMELNGILSGYLMSYQSITGLNLGRLQYREAIDDAGLLRARLTGLEPNMDYRIYLVAKTVEGKGEPIFLDAQTIPAGFPNPPVFDIMALGENHVEVHWEPSRSGNPGSVFYVQHRARGSYTWFDGPDEVLNYQYNVTGLHTGTTYQIRVVAKNGESYQSPAEWQEFTTGGIAPGAVELATSGWFYGIFVALVLVIIIVVLFMVLKRYRDRYWDRKESEIAEQVRQLQAEDVVAQMGAGITNHYAIGGSREQLADMSHASLHGSIAQYKEEEEESEEEESEEEDQPDYNYNAGPPQYNNLPAQQTQYGYHPTEGYNQGGQQVGYHPGAQVGYHPGFQQQQQPPAQTGYRIQDPPGQGSSFI